MKKIIFSLIVILFLTAGCNKNVDNKEYKIGNESNIQIEDKGVSLLLKENTLTNEGMSLVIKNNSNNSITYGEGYEIEKYIDGKWHKINVELNFNLIGYILNKNEDKEMNINWKHGYGPLSTGKYRIIKKITLENNEEKESFYISLEFTLE